MADGKDTSEKRGLTKVVRLPRKGENLEPVGTGDFYRLPDHPHIAFKIRNPGATTLATPIELKSLLQGVQPSSQSGYGYPSLGLSTQASPLSLGLATNSSSPAIPSLTQGSQWHQPHPMASISSQPSTSAIASTVHPSKSDSTRQAVAQSHSRSS